MTSPVRKGIRIAIVGTSGSGKTTLAKKLCDILHCPHIEIDSIAWNPGWVQKNNEEILQEIQREAQQSCWVACGNYSLTRDIIWKEATHLIWLSLPFRVVFWRILKRTLKNIFTKKKIAGNNVESFYLQFFTKKSIFLWILKTHGRRKKEYPLLFASKKYDPLDIIILHSQKEIDVWLTHFASKKDLFSCKNF